ALTPAIQSLARVITETEDAGDLMGLAVPVSWLAGVVEGKAFDGEIKAILTSLTRAMKAKKNRDHLGNLVLALDSFYVNVPMLEGYDKALGTAVVALTEALSESTDEQSAWELALHLTAYTDHLEPGRSTPTLLRLMKATKQPAVLRSLALHLSDAT